MIKPPLIGTGIVGVLIPVCLAISGSDLFAQRYIVQKGQISFTSNAELELIKASSDKIQGLIDPQTNQFAFSIEVKSFRGFNSELQREHFNEKYIESERFPTARFSGKIILPEILRAMLLSTRIS